MVPRHKSQTEKEGAKIYSRIDLSQVSVSLRSAIVERHPYGPVATRSNPSLSSSNSRQKSWGGGPPEMVPHVAAKEQSEAPCQTLFRTLLASLALFCLALVLPLGARGAPGGPGRQETRRASIDRGAIRHLANRGGGRVNEESK
mmetsp:Transcript_44495/g.95942  ORF Transcript_44495/g.95942 Transcript_44495/m.95942 type:complete len:144 (-) Transcript_44495:326-757(-)